MKKPADVLDDDAHPLDVVDGVQAISGEPMSKFPLLKKAALGVAAVVSLLLLAVFLLPIVLPQTATKPYAERLLSRVVGVSVVINGDHAVRVLPSMRIEADGIVSDPNKVPGVLSIDGLSLDVNTIGVLAGHLNIERAEITAPRADLRALMKSQSINQRGVDFDPAWGWWRDMTVAGVSISNGQLSTHGSALIDSLKIQNITIESDVPRKDEAADGLALNGRAQLNGESIDLRLSGSDLQLLVSGNRWPLKLSVSSDPLNVSIEGSLALRERWMGDGEFSFKGDSIDDLAGWLGAILPSRGDDVFSLTGKIEKTGAGLELKDVGVTFGSTIGQANIEIAKGEENSPEVTGRFSAVSIDLGSNPLSIDGLERIWSQPAMPSGAFDIEWQRADWGGLSFGPGTLRLERPVGSSRITATLGKTPTGKGSVRGVITLDISEGMGALRADGSVVGFDIGTLSDPASGTARLLAQGETTVEISLFSVGGSGREISEALTGKASLMITKGVLNLPELKDEETGVMKFDRLNGSFNIAQGIAISEDILLKGSDFSMVADGQIDLTDWILDLNIGKMNSGAEQNALTQFHLSGPADAIEMRTVN